MSQAYSFVCCAVLSLCGCWAFFFFLVLPLLPDGCAAGMRCLVPTLAVQSQQPLVVGSPPAVTLSCTCSGGAGCWSQSFVPSCCFCLLSSLGVSAAAFCHLGLLSHSILLLFLAWVSSFGVYSGLGLRCCGPGYGSSLLLGGLSFPCPCYFSLAFTTLFVVQVTWVSWTFCWGFFPLDLFAGSSGWFALASRFSLDGFMVRRRCPSIS